MGIHSLVGQMLGQYELRELLGLGGMAAVYRGYQPNLRRSVAVKVLPPLLANQPGYIERFNREAETAAALEHRHIIPIYDYGTQRGTSYVVMRLLTGGTLADRIEQSMRLKLPLPSLGEVADLLFQLGSALDYAHSQGVIHRDMKPSNVMFDNQGSAYIVDFGIAKLHESTGGLTADGTIMGTPAYMAPEQWRDDDLSPATDQYAIGVLTYMLLTGREPFEAPTPYSLMHKHLHEMPAPPQMISSEVQTAITLVLGRAMAKDPAARFPTVLAFAQAFEAVMRGQSGEQIGFFITPVNHKPSHAVENDVNLAKRHGILASLPLNQPLIWAIGAMFVIVLVTLVVLLLSTGGGKDNDLPAGDGSTEVTEMAALASGDASHTLPVADAALSLTPSKTPGADEAATGQAIEAALDAEATMTALFLAAQTTFEARLTESVTVVPTTEQPGPLDDMQINTPLPTPVPAQPASSTPDGVGFVPTDTPAHTSESPLAAPVSTQTPITTPTLVGIITSEQDAVVRSCWSTACIPVTALPPGTSVVVLAEDNGWYWIQLEDGTTGWVLGPLLNLSPLPADETSPTPASVAVADAAIPDSLIVGNSNYEWIPLVFEFDGVEMVLVPAGCFLMGGGFSTDDLIHEVCFDEPFWIDRFEVTNAQFFAFGGQAQQESTSNDDDQPRDNVAWNEAFDFCQGRGVRLPTEAEWEFAARGPESWLYPWGDKFVADNVVYGANSNDASEPVGSRPAGASWVGAFDMSGNVHEWVADWYADYTTESQTKPVGPASGTRRVVRGGSWLNEQPDHLRATTRYGSEPDYHVANFGFRCARSIDSVTLEQVIQRLTAGEVSRCTLSTDYTVNTRGGPGLDYAVMGALEPGQVYNVNGQTPGNNGTIWYRLQDGSWVRSDVINPSPYCDNVPTITP
ncbi:MAG: SUMF1/EgtB/PvdO family nonheme iron enzyme [Anaerolineae bacterium]|nr:SUMF1/EgtB/PvdO family nonheme iron enzyme [Anaerolineae bacterium]